MFKLKNQHGEMFYDKLTYVYLEMPNFTKKENQLETRLDKWLYFVKNLEGFQSIPAIFEDEVFEQAFKKAELANFRQADIDNYEASLKVFRDNKAVYDYAVETAFDEGKLEVARNLKNLGIDIQIIIKSTGLSEETINKL